MADHRFGSVYVALGCQRRSTKPPPIVGQITTNLNSTPPIVVLTPLPTTTTTTAPKGCAQYVADAITAGWPADQAPMLGACDVSESHGASQRPTTAKTPQAAHTGLLQMNGQHKLWLMQLGYINSLDDLFNPDINLRAALHLYGMVGWSAWAATHG
jgi:hypothetical protein